MKVQLEGKVAALEPHSSNACKAIGDQHGFDFNRPFPPPLPACELAGVDLYALTHSHHDLFPDNCQPPQMLRTNLTLHGRGERYRLLERGVPFDFPS